MARLNHGIPPPLLNNSEIEELKGWMISQQYHTLHDISEWNKDGSWQGWKLEIPPPPPPLQHQVHLLFKYLKGASPLHQNAQDSRGWGAAGYTVKEGYKNS
jgi:hypothetical protein